MIGDVCLVNGLVLVCWIGVLLGLSCGDSLLFLSGLVWKWMFCFLVGVFIVFLFNWLSEFGLLLEGYGFSLCVVVNFFKDDIVLLKLLNFVIFFWIYLDIFI